MHFRCVPMFFDAVRRLRHRSDAFDFDIVRLHHSTSTSQLYYTSIQPRFMSRNNSDLILAQSDVFRLIFASVRPIRRLISSTCLIWHRIRVASPSTIVYYLCEYFRPSWHRVWTILDNRSILRAWASFSVFGPISLLFLRFLLSVSVYILQ